MAEDSRLRTPSGESAMDDTNDAVRVNAVVTALPSGAATAANQTTANSSLSSIDGKITACNTAAVIIASGTLTGITNSVAVTGTFWQATQPVSGTFWQATQPVSGTFWQATQPVSAASLPLPTGAATSALQGGGLPAALGAGGGLKVDGSGTALPVSLASVPSHAVTNAGTFAVQAEKAGTAAVTSVASSASNGTLLASNANRIGATIYNDSTAILYAKFGTTASSSDFTVEMAPEDYYEVPFRYTGQIDGIWASANGAAKVTELT